MAKQNITLDDVLYMDKNDFKEMLIDMSKAELGQIEKSLNDYINNSKQPLVGSEGNPHLKLNFVKNAKKSKNSLKKVIAKVKAEAPSKVIPKAKSKPSAPSLISSPNTPKNTGVRYNTSNTKGQGDFFGSSSAFRFIKSLAEEVQNNANNSNPSQMGLDFNSKIPKLRKVNSTKSPKLTISHLEPKALKQLKDVMGLVAKVEQQNDETSKPKIKRVSKHEKDKLSIRKQEAELRKEHLDELKYKHRSDKRLELRKIREHAKIAEQRFESQRASEEFKDKVEKNKTKRYKLSAELKRDLSNNHVELNKIKLSTARLNRLRAKDQAEAREKLQEQRKRQINRNQMERHLHGIHPALGMLYSMHQAKKDSQPQGNSGGGNTAMTALMASGAGSAAGMLAGGLGKGALKGIGKMGGTGGGIAVLSSAILGLIEGHESGDATKGIATFGGSLVGMRLGAMAGSMLMGPVGGIVGGILGGIVGETAIKNIYNNVFNKKNDTNSPIAGTGRFASLNKPTSTEVVKKKGVAGRLASLPENNPQQNVTKISEGQKGFEDAMTSHGIVDPKERAMLLAQVQHESGNFKHTSEIGDENYFKKYDGRKDLGNTMVGDGAKYKGRGYIQLTGKANYQKAGKALGLDLVNNPELASSPENAAKIAFWYWENRKTKDGRTLAQASRDEDVTAVTKAINGGTNGLADRGVKFNQNLAQMTPIPKVASLTSVDNAIQQKTNSQKSQPTPVIIQGGSTNSSPTSVTNNTTIHAPNTDATIRQVSVAALVGARIL